jgi:hypothetical protein
MKDDQVKFLALLGKPPARLVAEQVAWVLNCQPHDVPILVATRLLKPLGNPPVNGIKYFSASDVLELSNDRGWLTKATNAITQHWQKKNGKSSARLQRSNNFVEFLPSLTTSGADKQTA